MDFQRITQEKYLQYFLSDCEHSISDNVMTEFLNDMITMSEQMDMTVSSIDIIREIMDKHGLEGSILNSVSQIASGNLVEELNALELFTLLWLVSCRNTLTYEEGLYLNMANNKTIGNLLKRLAVIYA